MWTKATVLGGVAALALVAGGAGMAIASAQGTAGPDVATVSPTGDPRPTVSPSANPAKAGKIDRDGLKQILGRLEHGQGSEEDLEKLLDICDNILGRSFCALGDAATSPITSAIKYFREEFEAGMTTPAHELFPPEKSVLFAVKEPSGMVSA